MNIKAMTVPELIIVVVLIMVIVGAAITPYMVQQDLLKKQFSRNRLQDDISVSLAYLEKDIYRASEIARVGGGAFAVNPNVSFSDIRIGIDNDPVLGAEEYYNYDLSGTDLQRNGKTIADNISSISFTREANNLISITIEGQDRNQTITISDAIALRGIPA